ncbi:hypothetical protein [Luteimonas mephitis]|uniref:hypothetical protein n=1 Tax=Luteimonas mephitis TaxID=83615 RepID=UPI00146A2747|nr:hypothetical protein [Luteimonas mephitis]
MKIAKQAKDQERFARCAAEFISLISVKETNQRKRFPVHISRSSVGLRRDFSNRPPAS